MASNLPPAPGLSPERLLEVARWELAHGGLRALSFRRLGEAAGATMGALTYHLGSKADILSELIAGERRRDEAWRGQWRERLQHLDRLDDAAIATLLEHHVEDAVRGEARATQMIFADLTLRSAVDGEVATLMAPWLEDRRAFWRSLLEGRTDEAERRAEAILSYLADETLHSLSNGDDADYRLLRRMAMERLAHRLDPNARNGVAEAESFSALVQRLDPKLRLPGRGDDSELLNAGRRTDFAREACAVMMTDGLEAVTHRAVGERAGAPASTVAYHFRSAPDLLKAALAMVYLVAQGRAMPPADDTPEHRADVVARGTQAVALAAARDPSLRPYAIDLRRLRGENLHHLLQRDGCERADRLDAQTISLAGLGAIALAHIDAAAAMDRLLPWMTKRLRS
jgi:DNA-binding transcriptional regulator YbjK